MIRKWQELNDFKPISRIRNEWLIDPHGSDVNRAVVTKGQHKHEIVLTNKLLSRIFLIKPNCTTINYRNEITTESIIRGIKPEASVEIDGKEYAIGGLKGQNEYAYFRPKWIDKLVKSENTFELYDFEVEQIKERFKWKKVRWCLNRQWPPKGIGLRFKYLHSSLKNIKIDIVYRMYDNIPLLSKWVEIHNESPRKIRLNQFTSEFLAAVEHETWCQGRLNRYEYPNFHVESDYAFSAMSPKTAEQVIYWETDPDYSSQVPYKSDAPILLKCKPPIGPELDIEPNEKFESFRIYELIYDSTERERKGLELRKMYRTIAPWVTENPIFMHVRSADPEKVKFAIDQCVECGFEMVILTFGSGMN
ncbi:MAG: alpha-galactosidase, partial [Candidatus Lokiarchaeota archaeon]|nr:alpha-galactosidase [Candidatus Lokiarchaeota archaeon]